MLFFDIETDGLLDTVTQAHCLVIIDEYDNVTKYRPSEVHQGAKRLLEAIREGDFICGHNIINFDIPALTKLYSDTFTVPYKLQKNVVDTLVLSRLIYGNIKDSDSGLLRIGKLPGKLYGSHSLKAWGYRLGELKLLRRRNHRCLGTILRRNAHLLRPRRSRNQKTLRKTDE